MARDLWIALSKVHGLGSKKIMDIYRSRPNLESEDFVDPPVGYEMSSIIKNASVMRQLQTPSYLNQLIDESQKLIEEHLNRGIHVITIDDEHYPPLLRSISDPPVALYCRGNLSTLKHSKSIAVIGTRKPTNKGISIAEKIASVFSRRGFSIVSGLALGIDTAGHRGALKNGGTTIAVLAGSLEKIYPKENKFLADEIIASDGLLVSEHPIGTKTQRGDFVKRDRIQSGLSLGVCPIQTDTDGGSMHTVKYAKEQHRLLFCPEILEDPSLPVYRGITKIIQEYHAEILKDSSDYERLERIMTEEVLKSLINSSPYEYTMERNFLIAAEQSTLFEPMQKQQMSRSSIYKHGHLNDLLNEITHVATSMGYSRSEVVEELNKAWERTSRT